MLASTSYRDRDLAAIAGELQASCPELREVIPIESFGELVKDMIIRGGENLYPREIEEVLFRHPAIADVAVVGLPDDRWGEIVAAFIRPADPEVPTVAELRTYTREHLAPHKTPVKWFRIDELPVTGSGKVQTFRLVDRWHAGDTTTFLVHGPPSG